MRPATGFLLVFALAASAQPPIGNANLQSRAISGDFQSEFQKIVTEQTSPAWIGYAVPIAKGQGSMCCGDSNSCCNGCSLEGRGSGSQRSFEQAGVVQLEGPAELFVLIRVDQKQIDQIRTYTSGCSLDAGGLTFYWLTGVTPAGSLALLKPLALKLDDGRRRDHNANRALRAIALHAAPEGDAILEEFAAISSPEVLRSETAFWLGNARGLRGYQTLARMVKDDPSDKVREKAIFGLTQSKQPEAIDAIIQTAKNDKSVHVRGQALFWLAQKAGSKAAPAITDAMENDPETDVKKRAVFALTQLPKDEGVPLLIQAARSNRNAVVRKQAMFWLGQSKDPRALGFFEEVLTKK